MRKCVFISVVFLFMVGCAEEKPKFTEAELELIPLPQREGLPEATGGFVLSVCGQAVTCEEIISPLIEVCRPIARNNSFEQFKATVGARIEREVVSKVTNILLHDQAQRDAPENIDDALEKAVETEVRQFLTSFNGDYAKAEEELKKMGMDWDSFRKFQKKLILSQSYVQQQLSEAKPVTYSQLLDYYNMIKKKEFTTRGTIKFRLIDIEASKLEVADANEDRGQAAKRLVDELVGRIRAGEDFGKLAQEYSHGHRATYGGLWKPVDPESLAKPYDILAVEAEKIWPGQIAGPIEAGEHLLIMKLEEQKKENIEPFEKVQKQIEARIALERRIKTVDELSAKFVERAALGEKDRFVDFCVREIYKICNE